VAIPRVRRNGDDLHIEGVVRLKKSVMVIFVLIFILYLSACGRLSAENEAALNSFGPETGNDESAASPETGNAEPIASPKTSEPQPLPSDILETSETQPPPSDTPQISSGSANQCVEAAIQGERIYFINYYDNGTLYSMNTDGSDKRKLTDDRLQRFYVSGSPVDKEMMDTMGLHVVDVNFDGCKDVIILGGFAGAHGNTWYYCWLWDAETSSFIESESFAKICNPALDSEKKCIYSAGGSGAAYWGGSIYKFIDGEFVVTNNLDGDWNQVTETELINGKMEIAREAVIGEDEQAYLTEREYYNTSELWQLDNPRWYMVGGHHADKWLE